MPWLSRSASSERFASLDYSPAPLSPQIGLTSPIVTFVPALQDVSCCTSPVIYRQKPMQLSIDGLGLLLQNLCYTPQMVRSRLTRSMVRNAVGEWKDVRDIALHVLLIIIEFWGTVVILPAFLVLPGIVFSILCVMSAGVIAVLTWPLHGSRVVSSGKERKNNLEQISGVKLLYINGSITR
jgi:hypothetical protein